MMLREAGETVPTVSEYLGHAKSSITADLYVGRVPKALRRAADRWGMLLNPAAPEPLNERDSND